MLPARKRSYECGECHKFFRHQINLSVHACQPPQAFECDVCNATFAQYLVMQKHKEKYHSGPSKQSTTAHKNGNQKAKDDVVAEENEQIHHTDANDRTRDLSISDSIAAAATVTPQFGSSPSTIGSTAEGRIVCKKCGNGLCNSWLNLRRHAKTHLTDRQYNCTECPYSSWLKSAAEKHVAKQHKYTNAGINDRGVELRPRLRSMMRECFDVQKRQAKKHERIGCKKCGKVVQNVWLSRRCHAETHIKDIKHFNCSECSFGSVLKKDVEKHIAKRHKRTTNAVVKDRGPELKPRLINMLIECFDATKRGTMKDVKTRRVYTKTNTFTSKVTLLECKECSNKVSSIYQNCWSHAKGHMESKPYTCSQCGFVSSKKKKAKKHIRTHTYATVVNRVKEHNVATVMRKLFGNKFTYPRGLYGYVSCNRWSPNKSMGDLDVSKSTRKRSQSSSAQTEPVTVVFDCSTTITIDLSTPNTQEPGSKLDDTNSVVDTVATHLQSNVTSPLIEDCGLPGSPKWQNMLERVERVKQTIDALTKRYETLKKLVQDT